MDDLREALEDLRDYHATNPVAFWLDLAGVYTIGALFAGAYVVAALMDLAR